MGFESPRRDLGRPTLTFNVAFVFHAFYTEQDLLPSHN
jgi:hypothetical protein